MTTDPNTIFGVFPIYTPPFPSPGSPVWNADALQSVPITSTIPSDGDILTYNASQQTWELQAGGGSTAYVPLSGATMLGPIISDPSASAPTNPLELVNKNYLTSNFVSLVGSSVTGQILNSAGTSPSDPTALVNKTYLDGFVKLSGSTLTGAVQGAASASNPSNPNEIISKAYVQGVSSIGWKAPCAAASNSNLSATYSNGTAGVGATLTSTSNIAFTTDGYSPSLSDRILVAGQSTTSQNGIYTVTTVGDAFTPWVLTRSTDFNTSSNITAGSTTIVQNGTLYQGSKWTCTTTATVVGTSPILFSIFQPQSQLVAGNGITITNNVISASLNSSNLQFTASQINTIQNISSSSSPSFTGLTLSGLTPSQAVVTNGSHVLTSMPYTSSIVATSLVQIDPNLNTAANNFSSAFTTTATTGGATTLFVTSTRTQIFTGTLSQTVFLPSATTLQNGWVFEIWNDSTGSLSVLNALTVTQASMPTGSYAKFILSSNLTSAGTWDVRWLLPKVASYSVQGLNVGGTLTCTTPSATIGTSASTLAYFNVSKAVNSVTLQSNLTLSSGTLDTAQNIQTTSSPTFSNLSLSSRTSGQVLISSSPISTISYSQSSLSSSLIQTDSRSNIFTNNLVTGLTVSNTTGSIITLSASSSQNQVYIGNATSFIALPTITAGWNFNIWNDSTNILTLSQGSTVQSGASISLLSVNSSSGTFSYRGLLPVNAIYGTFGLIVSGTVNASTATFSNLSAQSILYLDGSTIMQSTSLGTSLTFSNANLDTVQKITPASSPTFANLILTSPGAGSIVALNNSGRFANVSVGSSLMYGGATLNTVQAITTSASPMFAGLTLSSITPNSLLFRFANFGLRGVILQSSLTFSSNVLNTVQSISTTSSPTFRTLTLSSISPNALLYANNSHMFGNVSFGPNLSFSGTLNTVQNISTTSSPTFSNLTLSGLTVSSMLYKNGSLSSATVGSSLTFLGSVLSTVQAVTTSSSPVFPAIRLTSNASTGYILKSDTQGNGTWVPVSSNAATSIQGTAGQILANGTVGSAQIGAITLTIPQNLATTSSPTFVNVSLSRTSSLSYFTASKTISSVTVSANLSFNGTLDTVQGIQTVSTPRFAGLGIGTSVSSFLIADIQGSVTDATPFGLKVEPSLTCNGTSSGIVVKQVSGTTFVNGSLTNTVDYINILPSVTATTTASLVSGLHVFAGSGTGTVTNSYGLYVENPSFGFDQYSASFLGSVQNTTLTANSIVYANASQVLSSASITANLSFSGGVIDTVQAIQSSSSPRFAKIGLGISPTTYSFENVGISYMHSSGTTYWGEYLSNTNVVTGSSSGISFQVTATPNASGSAGYIWNTFTSNSVSLLNFSTTLTPTASPTAEMILSNAGFLGLNSTVPHSELQTSNNLSNRKLTLFETANNNYQYFGFGVQAGILAYSVDSSSSNHVWKCGSSSTSNTELMRLTGDGRIAMGGITPPSSAQLSMSSTAQGFLPPVTVNASVTSPVQGLTIYDTGVNALTSYTGSAWIAPVIADANGSVTISGALTSATRTITNSYSLLTSDQNICVNNGNNQTVLTLPLSPIPGQTYHIVDISGTSNTIFANSTQPVNGVTTSLLSTGLNLSLNGGRVALSAISKSSVSPDGSYMWYIGQNSFPTFTFGQIRSANTLYPVVGTILSYGGSIVSEVMVDIAFTTTGNYVYISSTIGFGIVIKNASSLTPSVLTTFSLMSLNNIPNLIMSPEGTYMYAIAVGRSDINVGQSYNLAYSYVTGVNTDTPSVSATTLTSIRLVNNYNFANTCALDPTSTYIWMAVQLTDSTQSSLIALTGVGTTTLTDSGARINLGTANLPLFLVITSNGYGYVYYGGTVSVFSGMSTLTPTMIANISISSINDMYASGIFVSYVTQNLQIGLIASTSVIGTASVPNFAGPFVAIAGPYLYTSDTINLYQYALNTTTLINTPYGKADAVFNGTGWEVAMIPGNLNTVKAVGTLISASTFSSASSVSFTGLTGNNYLVVINNINCIGNILGLQISTSAGPSYTYITSSYTDGQTTNALATNSWTGVAGSTSYWTFGTSQGGGVQSTSGTAYLFNFSSGTPYYMSTVFANGFNSIQAGYQSTASGVTAIRFIPSSGTFSGSIQLYSLNG